MFHSNNFAKKGCILVWLTNGQTGMFLTHFSVLSTLKFLKINSHVYLKYVVFQAPPLSIHLPLSLPLFVSAFSSLSSKNGSPMVFFYPRKQHQRACNLSRLKHDNSPPQLKMPPCYPYLLNSYCPVHVSHLQWSHPRLLGLPSLCAWVITITLKWLKWGEDIQRRPDLTFSDFLGIKSYWYSIYNLKSCNASHWF